MADKKKKKNLEPDLFTQDDKSRRKIKEWEYPEGVKYSDVKVGDIFILKKSRDWDKNGVVGKLNGEVLEKGTYDSATKYFIVKILHPEREGIEDNDIRRYILKKK